MHVSLASAANELDRDTQVVVVHPPEELAQRPRLFGALQEVFGVRFESASERAGSDGNARLLFTDDAAEVESAGSPTLSFPRAVRAESAQRSVVEFSQSTVIDEALRGASLSQAVLEGDGGGRTSLAGEALALQDGRVVWLKADSIERLESSLAELAGDESLRDRIGGASSLPLIALVDFLRRSSPRPWVQPNVGAAFLFDDPNLHARSYGFVNYPSIAEEAARVGYHAAFAMIPLDTWFARRSVVDLFRAERRSLSLLIHGNNHVRRELGRAVGLEEHRASLAQALRRVEAFEERYSLRIDRVVAPPHGVCSADAAAAMVALGFEGLCISRPYPWLDRIPGDRPTAGWRPADCEAGGICVIPRLPLAGFSEEERVVRSFLRQPLILYGHHGDVRQETVLADVALRVNQLPSVTWSSIGQIARSLYATRLAGSRLDVRLFSKRVELRVPEGVDQVVLSTAYPLEASDSVTSDVNADRVLTVSIERRDAVDPKTIERPQRSIWPILRRGLSETRDRLQPVLSRD